MNRIIEMIKSKKLFVLCSVVFVTILSIWLVPFIAARIELSKLHIEDLTKIVYVEYKGAPLSSDIRSKRYCTAANNNTQVKQFIGLFQEGKIRLRQPNKKTSNMLFLYFKDDRVVNAYVDGDSLGFKYGKYWVDLKDIDGLITSMEYMDNIEIKELSFSGK